MQKRITAGLLAMLLAASLAACSSAPAQAEKETEAAVETTTAPETETPAETTAEAEAASLPDGVYSVRFDTDSGMFHVNEACEGRGVLTVADGKMTVHISLVSKSIVNLFPGSAEDAQKDGAEILEPTLDEVTYKDGYKETVYGFDVPVEALDTDFALALIGKKGTWYDHTVRVSDPQAME